MDGKVNNLNKDVFLTMQRIRARSGENINERDAQELKTAILKDKVVDAAEADLLKELTQDNSNKVNVSAAKAPGFNPSDIAFKTTSGKVKQLLTTALEQAPTGSANSDIKQLWSGGPDGLKRLTEMYKTNPEKTSDQLVSVFQKSWEQSNMGNGYKPLRDAIGVAYSGLLASPDPETQRLGRELLHKSIAKMDAKAGDSVPDFLYNWIRPGGYL